MATTLIAKERFFYGGRNIEMGEQFEADDIDVPLLVHVHTPKAEIPTAQPKAQEADQPDEAQPRPTRYKRRDMKAEE